MPSNDEIMVKLDAVHKDTSDIKHRLFGNGQPGLIRQVDRHEKFVNNRVWFERVLVSAAVVAAAGGAATGAVYLIRATGN